MNTVTQLKNKTIAELKITLNELLIKKTDILDNPGKARTQKDEDVLQNYLNHYEAIESKECDIFLATFA